MSLSAKLRRVPMRAVTGGFILNSGIGKLSADEQTAKNLHGLATGTYPFLSKVEPKVFAKGLAVGEIAIGGVVLAPFVSPVVAGAALMGFSGALLNLYWNTPGMHEENDPRPTQQGVPIAKDAWMFGIGAGLVADGLLSPAHDKHVELSATVQERRHGRAARKAKKANKKARKQALESAKDTQAQLGSKARKAAERAAEQAARSDAMKSAQVAAGVAAKRLSELREEYAPVVADKAKQARDTVVDYTHEYAPVVADKAKQARDTVVDYAHEYAPVVADKAKQARDTVVDYAQEHAPVVADKARQTPQLVAGYASEYAPVAAAAARQARQQVLAQAADLRADYGPVVAKKAKQVRKDARTAARRAAKDTRKQLKALR